MVGASADALAAGRDAPAELEPAQLIEQDPRRVPRVLAARRIDGVVGSLPALRRRRYPGRQAPGLASVSG